jgi:Pyruvate/2-oxoacid:ferredoxin oxidoreductase delta subunit
MAPGIRAFRGQGIGFRAPAGTEDLVSKIPNLQVRPDELDLYTEVDPLLENIPPLRGPNKLRYVATHRRLESIFEISPTLPPLVYMEFLQGSVDRYLVSRHGGRRPDPADLKRGIKEYATGLGFIAGVTRLDRRFITRGYDGHFPYSTAVVLGMEMRKEFLLEAPDYKLRRYPDYDVYRKAGWRVHRLAHFIRRKGVSCSARIPFDGAVIYPVHAITAGLGELGAFGGVVTPEFGPRQRWCMITVDSDLPLDEPRDFGVAAFCEQCLLCVDKCPARAIPREPLWWRGVYKRKVNDLKCWAFFANFKGCAICINACPFHRFGYRQVMEHLERTGEVLGREEIMAWKPVLRREAKERLPDSVAGD